MQIMSSIVAIIFFVLSHHTEAKEGDSCRFTEESVIVQLKSIKNNQLLLSTLGNKHNLQQNKAERVFSISKDKIPKNIQQSDYLSVKIKHTVAGGCPPEKIINIEKFLLGKLQFQIDEAFYYGGMFRINEALYCISKTTTLCQTAHIPNLSQNKIELIEQLNSNTLSFCSPDAINTHINQLQEISSNNYVIACGFTKDKTKEVPILFKMISQRLELFSVLL